MITCYVWMTGFGNFSFFYIKQDYSWLRVVQMLWRLNFSVLFLMWTHGNTYILYYICPLHTFYFLLVYLTMYCFSNINHTKYGIRIKLMLVGIIIFIIWDLNSNIFDFIFGWFLGRDKIIGATRGSLWEYYFRTSLDHYSSYLGMIFALNFPLAEQYFIKAKGLSLIITSILMGIITIYWYMNYYTLDKLEYNLQHSYWAIVPLISYIFFRNITPQIRSYVSMSMHTLGKTTLETYLLQHHIWLTSNAKTLLTIIPGLPYVNFIFASILFYFTSKELYNLTMSLRGMILPDNHAIALKNLIGMIIFCIICLILGYIIYDLQLNSIYIGISCSSLLFIIILFIISKYYKDIYELTSFQYVYTKSIFYATCISVIFFLCHFIFGWNDVGNIANNGNPVNYIPKPTGSMSFPLSGFGVLILSAIMIFTMDNFLGLGWLGLLIFGKHYDWDEAFGPLHASITNSNSDANIHKVDDKLFSNDNKNEIGKEDEMEALIIENNKNFSDKEAVV